MPSTQRNFMTRSILKTVGPFVFSPFILVPAAQIYVLNAYVMVPFQLTLAAYYTSAGTLTINVQRIRAGATVSVTNLSALAATSTRATAAPTTDGTQAFIVADTMQITISAIAGGVNLAVLLACQRT